MDGGTTEQWEGLLRGTSGAQQSWEKMELQVLERPIKAVCPPSLPAVGKLEAVQGAGATPPTSLAPMGRYTGGGSGGSAQM